MIQEGDHILPKDKLRQVLCLDSCTIVVKEIFLLQASFSKSQEGEFTKEYFFEEDNYLPAFICLLSYLPLHQLERVLFVMNFHCRV